MGPNAGLTRREFLAAASAGLAAVGLHTACQPVTRWFRPSRPIQGSIVGASHRIGHQLWKADFPPPERSVKKTAVIVGGGIAGLAAAWRLKEQGLKDFVLLEMESEVGGNARSDESPVTPYPWGAHYVPLPDRHMPTVCQFFEQLGVVTGYDPAGEPRFNERYLCFEPQERLFLHGRWQDDLFPLVGALDEDVRHYRQFKAAMLAYSRAHGTDGRKAFAIPIEESSRDASFRKLDRISMADYLDANGWHSPRLRWYVDYACRDDFGCLSGSTSAWAGIHYWAGRPMSDHQDVVLTWPEGNGWIVKKMKAALGEHCQAGALVTNVEPVQGGGVTVDYLDLRDNRTCRIDASHAVVACPQFIAARIVAPWKKRPPAHLGEFGYAPWMVANLWLSDLPLHERQALAWDNVLYDSDALGYVVATHQNLRSNQPDTVWTYYYSLAKQEPAPARQWMLEQTWEQWKDFILADLRRAHPRIERHISRIDVMLWGHGMIRPTPGFMWGEARRRAAQPVGPIVFAHTDLSGISIFEEALYRGFQAADAVHRRLAADRA